MKRATSVEELWGELNDQKTYTAHEQFTARVLMFIADNLAGSAAMQIVDRINRLEQETKELRVQLTAARKEAVDSTEEVRQMVCDQIPKLQDGQLVFETGDGEGNLVYAHVVAADVRPA